MRKLTNIKLITSGNIIELFEYKKGFVYGKSEKKSETRIKIKADLDNPLVFALKLENRKRTLQSSKSALKRLINANAGHWKDKNGKPFMPIFLNLTFAENITNIQKANYAFTKFKQRLDYEITGGKKSYLKYAGVIEFQKRGAVHYHIIFFNMPFIKNVYDKMRKIWGKGHIIINAIKDLQTVASYICKYMTKSEVDERLLGQKSYFTSKGLLKPVEILDRGKIENIINNIPEFIKPYENKFKSDFCEEIKYKRYDFANHKDEKEKLNILLEYNL